MRKKLYVLFAGACALSLLFGLGLGYFVFGGAAVSANIYMGAPPPTAQGMHLPGAVNPVFSVIGNPEPGDVDFSETVPVYNEETAHRYLVTVVDGYVTVFYANPEGNRLKVATTIPADGLSAPDQSQLEAGIKVYTERELSLLLQDYGS